MRPLLSKELLRGETDEAALEDEAWFADNDVELRLEAAVEALDPDARRLRLAGGETLAFDACVLATGSEPAATAGPGRRRSRDPQPALAARRARPALPRRARRAARS